MLLALAGVIVGQYNFTIMHYLTAFFWILTLLAVYFLFSGYKLNESSPFIKGIPKKPLAGLVGALLMSASIYMLQYAVVFLRTEVVFSFFSLTAVIFANHLLSRERPKFWIFAGFVIAFLCAYFTRMAGLALLGALIMAYFFNRGDSIQRRAGTGKIAVVVLICILGPGLWFVRNQQVATQDSTDYAAEFTQRYGLDLTKNHDLEMDRINLAGFLKRIADNSIVFGESCAKMLLNSNKGGAKDLLKLVAGAMCAFGLLWSLVRRRSFADYYCLLYLLLYLVWPFNQQQRFYMPLLPFLFEYAAITIGYLNRLLPPLLRQKGIWFLFCALQIPVITLLFTAESQEKEIMGRYSYHYLAFAVMITLVLLVVDIYLLIERFRPGSLKTMVRTIRLALVLIYLLGFTGLGLYEINAISDNHRRFLEHRQANPVAPFFDRFETHPELIKMAQWIRENTPENTVIMSDIPKMLHMLTDRRTVPFTFYGKQNKLAETVQGLKPAYVCYSGEIGWVYTLFKEACRDLEMIISHRVDAGGGEMIEPGLYRMRQ